MLKSKFALAGGICAALLFAQQASADVLLASARHQFQGVYSSETTLALDLGGSRALSFSTTATNTKLAIELSATCFIGFASSDDYLDMDILVDGVALGNTFFDTPLCSMIYSGTPGVYLGTAQSVALNTFVSVKAGTHTLEVRARTMVSPSTTQGGISALHVNIIK